MIVNYRNWGGNGPPMILIHGLASSMRIWDYLAPWLMSHFTVLTYDQRGHGSSQKPEGKYDLPTMLADLVSLVDKLELTAPIMVGHSWGATLALAYASGYPGNCGGVALVDGGAVDIKAVPGASWERISMELAPPHLSSLTLDDIVKHAQTSGLENISAPGLRDFYKSIMDEQPDGTVQAILNRENHMQILRAIWDADVKGMVEKLKAALFLMMAEDPVGESAGSIYALAKKIGVREVEELNANAKVVWLANTIHDIPLQRPERLAEELVGFFSGPTQ